MFCNVNLKKAVNMSKTMQDVPEGGLFILSGIGVLRKVHPCQGQTKAGKIHVIYPNESVSILVKKRHESKGFGTK